MSWARTRISRIQRMFRCNHDQGLAALIEDLHARGLDKDVAVCAWGEFGRTPRINKQAGRDHWPQVGGGLLAGGGFRTGQAVGATESGSHCSVD